MILEVLIGLEYAGPIPTWRFISGIKSHRNFLQETDGKRKNLHIAKQKKLKLHAEVKLAPLSSDYLQQDKLCVLYVLYFGMV